MSVETAVILAALIPAVAIAFGVAIGRIIARWR